MSIHKTVGVPPGASDLGGRGAVAGLDIGRKRHPSHLSILLPHQGRLYQVASVWLDQETYTAQLEELSRLFDAFEVHSCLFDGTRGEFAILSEESRLPPPMQGGDVTFTVPMKERLAGSLNLLLERRELFLLQDERQKHSILSVSSTLKAEENELGHGDAFWSLALAIEAARRLGLLSAGLLLHSRMIPMG